MENLTQEQIEKSVNAAFDSVNLIESLSSSNNNEEKAEIIKRNIDHLKIMMSKDWFKNALTQSQLSKINSLING
jgi:stress-induced morphogen